MVGGGLQAPLALPTLQLLLRGHSHVPVLTWLTEPAVAGMCLEAEHSQGV